METDHRLNQCGIDWITCRCGKLFKDGLIDAKEKFIHHLEAKGVGGKIIMTYDIGIQRQENNKCNDLQKNGKE
jgi:hypothetical protein